MWEEASCYSMYVRYKLVQIHYKLLLTTPKTGTYCEHCFDNLLHKSSCKVEMGCLRNCLGTVCTNSKVLRLMTPNSLWNAILVGNCWVSIVGVLYLWPYSTLLLPWLNWSSKPSIEPLIEWIPLWWWESIHYNSEQSPPVSLNVWSLKAPRDHVYVSVQFLVLPLCTIRIFLFRYTVYCFHCPTDKAWQGICSH